MRDLARAAPSIHTALLAHSLGVCVDGLFCTWNLTEGPLGAFATHIYRSFLFLASKNTRLLQFFISASSLTAARSSLASNLASRFECGSRSARSDRR